MCSRGNSWFNLPVPPTGKPLQNALWLTGERILRIAVTAGVLALVARHLQPAGFGHLGFAISFTGLFTPLAFLGLEALLVSELVRRPADAGALLGTACILRLLAGGLSAALCVGLAFSVPALDDVVWLIVPLSLGLLWQSAEVVDAWFQRHLQSRCTATARLAAVLAGAAIKMGLVWLGKPAVWFAWAVMFDVILFEVGLLFAYARLPERPRAWTYNGAIARQLIARAWPLALAGLLFALQARLDQFFVKATLSADETGAYFAAVRLVELPLFVMTAIGLSLFPALAASRARTEPEFAQHAQRVFDLLSGFAWLAAIGISVTAVAVVSWLFGRAYDQAVPSLLVLAWVLIPWAGMLARQQCILLGKPTWLQVAAAIIGIVVQLPLAWWLVSRLGGPGAAVSSVLASLAAGWLTSFILPGLRDCASWQTRAVLIPFQPHRWRAAITLLQ